MLDTRRCLDVNVDDLQQELDRQRAALGEAAYAKLRTAVEALRYLQELVADQTVTMAELRRLIVIHGGTEKTAAGLRRIGLEAEAAGRPALSAVPAPDDASSRIPARGHGRRGATAVAGARRIVVPHETLRAGDRCPECGRAGQRLPAAGAQTADPIRRPSAAGGHSVRAGAPPVQCVPGGVHGRRAGRRGRG